MLWLSSYVYLCYDYIIIIWLCYDQWCNLAQRRKCETTKESPPMLFTIAHFPPSLYKHLNDQLPWCGWACPAIPWHSGAMGITVHCMAPTRWPTAFISFSRNGTTHSQIIYRFYTTLINLSPVAYMKKDKIKRRRERCLSCHHYSSMPSGGLWETDRGALDDKDSEARWNRVQKTSISSFIRLALYPDPSNSNSSYSASRLPPPLMDPVGGRSINMTLSQIHGRGQCCR
jgi:hypothetical protein